MVGDKGFTLIELLVVIAIIGVLSSIVLASLNNARGKASDSAIKASLANSRAQAELFNDSKGSYVGVCTLANQNNGGIYNMITSAAQKLGSAATVEVYSNGAPAGGQAFAYSTAGAAGTLGDAVCHDSASGWAAIVSLKNPTTANSGWCVDSAGKSSEQTTLGATSILCGS